MSSYTAVCAKTSFQVLLFCLGISTAWAASGDPLKCDFSVIEGPMVTEKIENSDLTDAELKIPRDYLMSRAIDGATRDALLLQVWKDSFLPYTMSDAHSADQGKKFKEGRADNLLVLISALKSLDEIAKLKLQLQYPLEGDVNENRKQPVSGPLIRLNNGITGYRDDNGLIEQEKLPTPRAVEPIFGVKNGEITDVFQCSQIGDAPFATCNQIFEVGVYDVKISYYRNDLPKWQELKQKTEKLLACLTTKQPKER